MVIGFTVLAVLGVSREVRSSWWGKASTLAQMFALAGCLAVPAVDMDPSVILGLRLFLAGATVLNFLSGLEYAWHGFQAYESEQGKRGRSELTGQGGSATIRPVIDGLDPLADPLLHLAIAVGMLLLAVSVHEAGHAWAALKRGDPTALRAGRVSLLPFSHFDWIGCLFFPVLLVWAHSPYIIGFGRPTPVDPASLKHPKADFSLVSLAGPWPIWV